MTKPHIAALLLLPLSLTGACASAEDDTEEYEDLAAHLADHVGIEEYEIVVLEDQILEADEEPTDEPPNASLPDDLAADDDPTMACRMTGWIGHTPVCRVCTLDWFWVACIESVDCGDGDPYLRYCSTATPGFEP